MDASTVDTIQLNFSQVGLNAINAVIGLMMFGVALDMKLEDFVKIAKSPKAPLIGLVAQFILLPAFTFGLTMILGPLPSLALGMILVAACPGGNLSNLMTYLAGGNVAVSISMTAISTLAAIVMTPLNLTLWGSLNPDTAPILKQVSLSPVDVFVTVFVILGIPLIAGLLVARWKPALVEKVRRPFKILTVIIFIGVVGGALAANWKIFLEVIGLVIFAVLLHNALAIGVGWGSARLMGLPPADRRAVAIEVGIQNSALGLVLVFNFFDGLGGMAILVAWWGIWHIIAGLTLAFFWSRTPILTPAEVGSAYEEEAV
ncbi:MAG: bile acid:sodium symporter family protein [Deltaproteobacteria bacterium]|nr:bile acid:sodium symporter family protein [Deltaproteobacteria bacterium]